MGAECCFQLLDASLQGFDYGARVFGRETRGDVFGAIPVAGLAPVSEQQYRSWDRDRTRQRGG
jgi:hypothetical protein